MSNYEMGQNPWYYIKGGNLVKERKPCMPGDRVHLHRMDGCFTVHYVYTDSFVVMKNRKLVNRPWEDLRCISGQGNSKEKLLKEKITLAMLVANCSVGANLKIVEDLKEMMKELKEKK